MTVAITLLVMAGFRVWSRTGRRRAQPIAGPAAAALLVLLSGLTPAEAGLVLSGLWYALSTVILIATGYAIAALIPAARGFFEAQRAESPVYAALVGVPLSTVTFEEVAFRGVLWGLIARDHGPIRATAVTALLFGLWHLSWEKSESRVSGEVAFTTLSGVLLGALRHFSGGLLTPFVLHWTANGLGILVSAGLRRPGPAAPEEHPDPR